jgi:hypothetical protein
MRWKSAAATGMNEQASTHVWGALRTHVGCSGYSRTSWRVTGMTDP